MIDKSENGESPKRWSLSNSSVTGIWFPSVFFLIQKSLMGHFCTLIWKSLGDVTFLWWINYSSKIRGGVLEMAQKVIEGGVVTWRHMHEKLDSRYWLLWILSHLRVSGLKKWAISKFWHVIEILSQFEVEPSQNLMHMPSRDKTSFDDFLSHLKDPPVHWIWLSYFGLFLNQRSSNGFWENMFRTT